jgi:hypothetical protein
MIMKKNKMKISKKMINLHFVHLFFFFCSDGLLYYIHLVIKSFVNLTFFKSKSYIYKTIIKIENYKRLKNFFLFVCFYIVSSVRIYSPISAWCNITFAVGSKSRQYSVGCAAIPNPNGILFKL